MRDNPKLFDDNVKKSLKGGKVDGEQYYAFLK